MPPARQPGREAAAPGIQWPTPEEGRSKRKRLFFYIYSKACAKSVRQKYTDFAHAFHYISTIRILQCLDQSHLVKEVSCKGGQNVKKKVLLWFDVGGCTAPEVKNSLHKI